MRRIAREEKSLDAFNTMRGLSVAANAISQDRGTARFYHLIVLDSEARRVRINSFPRDGLQRAIDTYNEVEAEATGGARIEPVLVSAGPLETLRRAYPNFLLDIADFTKAVRSLLRTR